MTKRRIHKKVAAKAKDCTGEGFPAVLADDTYTMATDGKMLVAMPHPGVGGMGERLAVAPRVLTEDFIDEAKATVEKGRASDGCFEADLDDLPRATLPKGFNSLSEMVYKAKEKCDAPEKQVTVCIDLDRLVKLARILYAGETGDKRKVVRLRISKGPKAPVIIETTKADARAYAILAACLDAGEEPGVESELFYNGVGVGLLPLYLLYVCRGGLLPYLLAVVVVYVGLAFLTERPRPPRPELLEDDPEVNRILAELEGPL